MENNENLFAILMGLTVIVGLIGTIAYYFARYGFKSDKAESSPSAATHVTEKERSLEEVLAATRASLWDRVKNLVALNKNNSEFKEQFEEILYGADLGVHTVERLLESINSDLSSNGSVEKVQERLKSKMLEIFSLAQATSEKKDETASGAQVWLVVGVNGAGKTTSIGKLAYQEAQKGRKVLLAAGDTFRAAAGEQLKVWTDRAQVEVFSPPQVEDPAAVAFQALDFALKNKFDLVIIDTAGRLHTQKNLMEELKKVKRVLQKLGPQFPQETLLVLDANSGQNALVQAKEFNEALNLTGVILTKMDGSSKGGVALSLAVELRLVPKLIGVGEKIGDLRPFDPKTFVEAIL